ncbi:MAG: hypothetical protein HZC49_08410 [Nitrospirae bacterium]|nr:hypothetical protein [Nitrospirota bacterium]
MILDYIGVHEKQFAREIELFLVNTDKRYWEKIIKKFDAEGGVYYRVYLQTRNPLAEGIRQYLGLLREGKSLWKHRTREIDDLVQIVFTVNRILKHVSAKAKKEIISKLTSEDIRSFLHELTIATHFLRNRFNVEFVEYERSHSTGTTFDFLVTTDSMEAEIECKTKSYDAGRRVTRKGFYLFCDEIIKQLSSYKVKCVIELNCSNQLGQDQSTFRLIAQKLRGAIEHRSEIVTFNENLSLSINYLSPLTIIDSAESFASVVQPFWTPQSHFATLSNSETTIIIKVQSEAPDIVLQALYNELKGSLNQFSSKRPALIACHIEGIYPEQWEELRKGSGLAAMTSRLLGKEKAAHIHTIAYSSEIERIRAANRIDITHPVLFFTNDSCSRFKDQDIFSLTAKER